jgi:hypothetical protein
MVELLSFELALDYPARVDALFAGGIAVWDVLSFCTRASSLDSDIDDSSMVVNDFARSLADHPRVLRVCFSGAEAVGIYRGRRTGPADHPHKSRAVRDPRYWCTAPIGSVDKRESSIAVTAATLRGA